MSTRVELPAPAVRATARRRRRDARGRGCAPAGVDALADPALKLVRPAVQVQLPMAHRADLTPVTFETRPSVYKHWTLAFDGPVATLSMDVQEDAGLSPDYRLKLNSYDLAVDI